MSKPIFLIASSLTLMLAASSSASAQYIPLGPALDALSHAAAPAPRANPAERQRPEATDRQKRRPTHIIPPQSAPVAQSSPRRTSPPSEDND